MSKMFSENDKKHNFFFFKEHGIKYKVPPYASQTFSAHLLTKKFLKKAQRPHPFNATGYFKGIYKY